MAWGLWIGTVLSLVALWLAVTGDLVLYIHPRYVTFTTVLAAIGLLGGTLALIQAPVSVVRRRPTAAIAGMAGIAVIAGLAIIPARTLSSAMVEQRTMNSALAEDPALRGADPASFRVRDWAAVAQDSSAATRYAGTTVRLIGFVTQAPQPSPDHFYLARFILTCCAVDAQPVGVSVTLPGWVSQHPVDSWVEVTGRLTPAPSGGLQIEPESVKAVEQPEQPYE